MITAGPPTAVEAIRLAQQATLETRDAKHEPRTLDEQRATWHKQAAETLGGPEAVQSMINRTLHPTKAPRSPVDGQWLSRIAGLVLAAVEERRSTWQTWHVRAEAQRHVRAAEVPTGMVDELVDGVVAEVLNTRSVSLALPNEAAERPDRWRACASLVPRSARNSSRTKIVPAFDASHIEHRKRRLQPSAPVAEPALMIARCGHRDLGDTKTCFDAPGTEKG
jgi:hypothetical protein